MVEPGGKKRRRALRDRDLYERILGLVKPWCVEEVQIDEEMNEIVIQVGLKGSVILRCPECEKAIPGYDRRKRRWRHLDTCQYKTWIEAEVPRGECEEHGVKQIGVPWAEDRSRFTALFERLAIDWIREASQSAVSRKLSLTWDEIHGIMDRAVARGMSRREEEVIPYMGVDEKSFQKRHEYVTVTCDLEKGRVLYVGKGRKKESLDAYWEGLSEKQLNGIEGVAMDMWEGYIRSTTEHVPDAVSKIVFDKFHVIKHLNEAVDKVRRQEHKILMREGDESLKGTKYWWLKRPWRIGKAIRAAFRVLRKSHLRTARSWALKEMITRLWNYVYPGAARNFFERWYSWAIRSRLEPIKKVARMIKDHLENILTYLKHPITNAMTEGINSKIQWIKHTARGFRSRKNFRTAILFHCGGLDLYPH